MMSELERLIEELCPEGVEYKSLGDFATITRGGNFQKKDFAEIGVPCIHYGQIYTRYGLFADRTFTRINKEAASKSRFASQNDIVMAVTSENVEDVCKSVAWLGSDDIAVSGHTAIIRHNQNSKYLSYYFHSSMFFTQKVILAHGTKVIEVTPDKLSVIRIPIPPLPIQEEIVRILDAFTTLEAELEAELEARKKQYEYYRDKLLNDELSKRNESLGNVLIMKSGKSISSADISDVITQTHIYPCYGGNGLRGYVKDFSHNGKFVIVGRQGALCGNVKRVSGKFYATEHAVVIQPRLDLNIDWVFYVLTIMNLNQYATKSAQPGLSVGKIEELLIPVPSLSEQARIVEILDRFDALTNDITVGLPAEIAARRKQYEYYRDKLLLFKEKVS